MKKRIISTLILGLFVFVGTAYAHQPRLVYDAGFVEVETPEISQAFYGELVGEPAEYKIESKEDFLLYLNVLSPATSDSDTDFSLQILQDGEELEFLDGEDFEWVLFHEEFANDEYWEGPEFEEEVPAGVYTAIVSSPDNEGKYVLAVGKVESFPLSEIIKTLWRLPKMKTYFFDKSFVSGYLNLFSLFAGVSLLVSIGILGLLFLLVRKIYGKVKSKR